MLSANLQTQPIVLGSAVKIQNISMQIGSVATKRLKGLSGEILEETTQISVWRISVNFSYSTLSFLT
jgi:hypothetical protein